MFIYEVKKDDCKLKICVSVSFGRDCATYTVSDILITPKRKRKAISIAAQIRDQYDYRCTDYLERDIYVRKQYLKYCTEEDIENALQYAYFMMKPALADVAYRAT